MSRAAAAVRSPDRAAAVVPIDRMRESDAALNGDDGRIDPDLPLVRRIADGDAAAFADLVDRHLGRIGGLARRMLGSTADAEDVAQETFLRVWRTAGRWQEGNARFSTWLHRVAVNLCNDRLRRRPMLPIEAAGDPVDEGAGPADRLERQAVAARVETALAKLPERQRMAILLCHYQELGNIEAAETMEVSVEALESLLSRGRRRLRELLAAEAAELLGDQ